MRAKAILWLYCTCSTGEERVERLNNAVTESSLAENSFTIFHSSPRPPRVNVLIYLEAIDPKLWTLSLWRANYHIQEEQTEWKIDGR